MLGGLIVHRWGAAEQLRMNGRFFYLNLAIRKFTELLKDFAGLHHVT